MKKITLCFLLLLGFVGFSQQKTTEMVDFLTNLKASITLENSTETVTLTLSGPSDRWFALTFGEFNNPGAMNSGNDVVYYDGTTLVDATQLGEGVEPDMDDVNSWTVISNTVTEETRTIVATRPFVAEATDYTFIFSNNTLNLAGAHGASPGFSLAYHQDNRFNAGSVPLTTLGIEDFSLQATQIFPNPSSGNFTIKIKTSLEQIAIYSLAGTLLKTIETSGTSDVVEIDLQNLQTGTYLVELKNEKEKSWKKIIIN